MKDTFPHTGDFSKKDLQSHRLMNLGALSTAVAHDLNNLLFAILSSAHILNKKLRKNELTQYTNMIEETAKQANELTASILHYAKGEKIPNDLRNPVYSLKKMINLAKKTLDRETSFHFSLPKISIPLAIQETEFHQIFLNLFFNAKESIRKDGHISIKGSYKEKKLKKYFSLEVEDNGPGISEEFFSEIFKPFYSQKNAKNSSGLGLAIIKKIIEKIDGDISIRSIPNQLTSFSVLIPVSKQKN